jgi:hypothetical protein
MAWPVWHFIQLWIFGYEGETSRTHGVFPGFSGMYFARSGHTGVFLAFQFKANESACNVPKVQDWLDCSDHIFFADYLFCNNRSNLGLAKIKRTRCQNLSNPIIIKINQL